ncbi:glycine cleavage system protein H [Candidatus Thorarchaeota archaeon]|nr:MAG: glycine cleavage system protein H [Candidatus Thorarchaeota archaeon]
MVTVDEFEFPEDLYYFAGETDSLWLKKEDGKVRLGITPLGAYAAGKIKFIRLRPAGKTVKSGRSIGTLESGKWTGAVKAPVGGEIVEVNDDLKSNPGLINDDPYGKGWVAVLEPEDISELEELQGADGLEEWAKEEVASKKAMKGE